MVSDSISNVSIPIASSNPKDFSKKKANRSAKLKQCKLDARREQWLSQVKNKGLKEESNSGGTHGAGKNVGNERERLIERLQIKPRSEEENEGPLHQYSDFDSPTSHVSSVLEGNDSGINFTGSSSSSSSSHSSGGCCSGSVSEEDEEGEDDDCLDDWETIADAMVAADKKQEQQNPCLDSHFERDENVAHMSSRQEVSDRQGSGNDKSKQERNDRGLTPKPSLSCRAWRPDDTFRPSGLPNLSKQYSFPMNSERHCRRGSVWGCKGLYTPTSCPICCEDLDCTDTSFLPCSCGFRLCLFCHKRILEEDGRCPGCRKQYNQDAVEQETVIDGGSLTIRLARSCSMISRS
ncbi:unnamed protein product [Withania somnifera]